MMSPRVWVLYGPSEAVSVDTATEAAALVKLGKRVVLPDYQTGIRTLIKLGASSEHALHCAEVARQQPQEPHDF